MLSLKKLYIHLMDTYIRNFKFQTLNLYYFFYFIENIKDLFIF